MLIKELQSLSLDVRVLDQHGEEIDIKQKFDEDEELADAAATDFDEESEMTSMEGYILDEGGEEENMYDDSLADEEYDNDFDLFDDFGSDEL